MKRGCSGLSLVVGVNKPINMTSHDVVNRLRGLFQERRVGHMGTLDPLATGVLPLCVGPATRLGAFLPQCDKSYVVRMAWGASTTTDDSQGQILSEKEVPSSLRDAAFARQFLAGLVGQIDQYPPVYSALKVGGRKACDAARKGEVINLASRRVSVYEARLLGIHAASSLQPYPTWEVAFKVSKGTYIRSLVRDAGQALHCPAHVAQLERTQVGPLRLSECCSLEELGEQKAQAALNPLALLGIRFVLAHHYQHELCNGAPLPPLPLFQLASSAPLGDTNYLHGSDPAHIGEVFPSDNTEVHEDAHAQDKAETLGQTLVSSPVPTPLVRARIEDAHPSTQAPADGELVGVITQNRLKALYVYNKKGACYTARCVFQTGVSCDADI